MKFYFRIMPHIKSLALPLCLIPLLACAAKKAPVAIPAEKPALATWTCPDTLSYILSEVNPGAPGRPWKAPSEWGRDTARKPEIHPRLAIAIIESRNGKPDTGEKEFIEPNFPWVGDLNGDGLTDFVLRDGIGQSRETAILVNCGKEKYYPVLHAMTDEIRVEEDPDPKRKWKLLHHEFWPIGAEDASHEIHRWNGNAYSTCCKYQGSVPRPRNCCP